MHLSKKIFFDRFFSGQILLTDKLKLPDPTNVIKKLPAFSILIIRNIESYKLAKIKQICLRKNILLSIANNHHMAQQIKSEGFHVKEQHINNGITKLPNNKNLIRSISCHTRSSALKAQKLGYDFILYSPIFNTSTHTDYYKKDHAIGTIKFSLQTKNLIIPIIALGGINKKNINRLKRLNIKGFAAIDYYL